MLAILAQANRAAADDDFIAFLVVFLIVVACIYAVLLVAGIFFLAMLQKALRRCEPSNRTMEPAMVWLNLIPLFQLVWMFITAIRVSESLKNEYRNRGWHRRQEDYGQSLGIVTCALLVGSNMVGYCGIFVLIGWLVCWIMYWGKIAGFSAQLASNDYERRPQDDFDDDYENDRPTRRRRRRDDDYDDERGRDRDEDDRRDDRGERKPWDRGN